jgi:nucleotide-binding universal stress UspA family protein
MIAPGPESLAHDVIRPGALDRALLESGVPMLILPPDWTPGPIGDNIVIAWNAGREALRAVYDARPLLERAKKVTLFAFSSRPSGLRKSAQMLVDRLAAHGVKAEHISDWTNTGGLTAVEALFASLDTQDADLFVAGAFGHSRLYQGLFGGVSMDLTHQQSLPVLMSHWPIATSEKYENLALQRSKTAAPRGAEGHNSRPNLSIPSDCQAVIITS